MIKLSKHTKGYGILIFIVLASGTGLFFQWQAYRHVKVSLADQETQTQQTQVLLTQEEQAKSSAQAQVSTLLSEKGALEKNLEAASAQLEVLESTKTKLKNTEKTLQSVKQQDLLLHESDQKNMMSYKKKLDQCLENAAQQQDEVRALNRRIEQLEARVN